MTRPPHISTLFPYTTLFRSNLNGRALHIGDKVMNKFEQMHNRYDAVGDVRGLGAMCALEFVQDRKTKEPDKQLTNLVIEEARQRGLITLKAGLHDNVIRLLMPLVITDEQLDEGLAILEESLEAVLTETVKPASK